MKANDWIESLQLLPHPEGGYYKEVFRSEKRLEDGRSAMTSIYYLLENHHFSAFHRLKSPEIWYFHSGVPLMLYVITLEGELSTHLLSSEPSGIQQLAIEPGNWFAAELPSHDGYALVSCAVAPAFSFEDFELADLQTMQSQYPQHASLLQRMCVQ